MRRPISAATLCAAAALAVSAALPAHTSASVPVPVFDGGRILPGHGGGEPSLAVDLSNTASRGDVYVEAIGGWGSNPPPGDPAGSGPVLWHSYDGGRTWSAPVAFDTGAQDSLTGGEDGDVIVDQTGNVIVTDLAIDWSWVQVSTDHGQTFNTGTPTAPEDDRPWLTAHGSNVYLAYHDFAAELPVVCTSTDGGNTFPVCNPFTLTGPDIAVQCAENTIPARPLSIDPVDGSLNFLFSCSTTAENLADPPYGPLHDYYLAQSTDGGTTWSDYPVFVADTSGGKQPNFANIFSTLGIDSAGNYYAVFAGSPDDPNVASNPYHVWLVTSTDHGHTWTKPVQVDTDAAGTHTQPHFVVTSPGNVDVVYYRTAATGEPNGQCSTFVQSQVQTEPCQNGFAKFDDPTPKPPLLPPPVWEVDMAQSTNALSPNPTFTQTRVSGAVHVGEICTNGIVCGSSDRTLLDFMTVQVDCNGLAHIAFAGNTPAEEKAESDNGNANIHEVNQVGGSTIAAPAACASTAGSSQTPAPTASSSATPTATATPTAGVRGLPNTTPSTPAGTAVPLVGLALGAVAAVDARRRRRSRRRPPTRP